MFSPGFLEVRDLVLK